MTHKLAQAEFKLDHESQVRTAGFKNNHSKSESLTWQISRSLHIKDFFFFFLVIKSKSNFLPDYGKKESIEPVVHCILSHPDQRGIRQKLQWDIAIAFSFVITIFCFENRRFIYFKSKAAMSFQPRLQRQTTCFGNYNVGLLVSAPAKQCLPPGEARRKTETFHSPRPALALQHWQR